MRMDPVGLYADWGRPLRGQGGTPTGTPTSPISAVSMYVRRRTGNARTCRNSTPTNTHGPLACIWGSSGRRFKSCQPDTGQRLFSDVITRRRGVRTQTLYPNQLATRARQQTCTDHSPNASTTAPGRTSRHSYHCHDRAVERSTCAHAATEVCLLPMGRWAEPVARAKCTGGPNCWHPRFGRHQGSRHDGSLRATNQHRIPPAPARVCVIVGAG